MTIANTLFLWQISSYYTGCSNTYQSSSSKYVFSLLSDIMWPTEPSSKDTSLGNFIPPFHCKLISENIIPKKEIETKETMLNICQRWAFHVLARVLENHQRSITFCKIPLCHHCPIYWYIHFCYVPLYFSFAFSFFLWL